GMIGALLAQGEELNEAARYGVALHSAAADQYVAEYGEWGVLATDLIPVIKQMLNFGAAAEDSDATV
ncbi:MAG: hypothetical protein OQK13_06360, partial [Gammaproteobacteria bacterium]|nr:hypothetical protein [Gammaproteobacteria bacterium]